MKRINPEIRNAIMQLKSCVVTPQDYVELLERRLDDAPISFGEKDAPLENNPFFHNEYEVRLLNMRYHLLKALGFKQKGDSWYSLTNYFIGNQIIKTYTDKEFLDAIEATGVKLGLNV